MKNYDHKKIEKKWQKEWQVKEIYNKSLNTKKEKYGDENYNNREKSKNTCLINHGVDNPMKSTEIREKAKKTNLNRYGVDNPNNNAISFNIYRINPKRKHFKQVVFYHNDLYLS